MPKTERIEIPSELAARVLFRSDRTCCVCRVSRKAVQIHHTDEDPSNDAEENLAVLCLECHHDTQLMGGFSRKLDADLIRLYSEDWHNRVEKKRDLESRTVSLIYQPPIPEYRLVHVSLQGAPVSLTYHKLSENDEEHFYSFEADFPLLSSDDAVSASKTNLVISDFVTKTLRRFQNEGIARTDEKREMRIKSPSPTAWDDLSIGHNIGMFNDHLLTVDFTLVSYYAHAVHSNTKTETFNFPLQPAYSFLEFDDLFRYGSHYLEWVSNFCITNLHDQLSPELKANYSGESDSWIRRGAAPLLKNFERYLLVERGLRIFFDPYEVGSYAEGRREVFIPVSEISGLLKEDFAQLLQ